MLDFYAGRIHFVRVFGGRLTPSDTRPGQTPEAAIERLPNLLQWCTERDIRIEITCLTDTAVTYDEKSHCRRIGQIARDYRQTVLGIEVKNEDGHSSQRPHTHQELLELKDIIRQNYDGPVALGACLSTDENDVTTGKYPNAWTGPDAYSTVHLNRGKKPSYREANRIKEQHDIQDSSDAGVCNNEMGRFDDASLNGTPNDLDGQDGSGHQRFAYLNGALGMAFGLMTVAHSSFARDIYVPTGLELDYFEAYLRGASVIPRGRYNWYNANNTGSWPSSPVKTGAFAEGPANSNSKALWRAYSYIGEAGKFVIASGAGPTSEFNIEYQNGYHPVGMMDEAFGVQIIGIE